MKRVVSLIVALVMIASMGILSVSADETKGVASYQIFVDGSDSAIVVDPATNLTAAGGFTPVPFSVEINAGAKIRIFGWNGNTAGGVSSYQYRIGDSGKKVDVNGNIAVAPAAMGVGAVIDRLLGEGYGEQCEPTALFDIEIPCIGNTFWRSEDYYFRYYF